MASPTSRDFLPASTNSTIFEGFAVSAAIIDQEKEDLAESQKSNAAEEERVKAEKVRKEAERAMEDSYATSRKNEFVNASSSVKKIISNDSNSGYTPMKSITGHLIHVPINKDSSCRDLLEALSQMLDVDISVVTIINSELPGGRVKIINCDSVDEMIKKGDCTLEKLLNKGNSKYLCGRLEKSSEIYLSDIKREFIRSCHDNVNFCVVKFIPYGSTSIFEFPIKKGSSCHDILKAFSTFFQVDIGKVSIFSYDIPNEDSCLNLENCDLVDQAIRSTHKSIDDFFENMSCPYYKLEN